jgi:hypothetical protein
VLPGHSMRGKTIRIAALPGASKRLILTAIVPRPQLRFDSNFRATFVVSRALPLGLFLKLIEEISRIIWQEKLAMTASPGPNGSPALYPDAIAPANSPSAAANIFKGPNGLRAGWRLLLFIVFFLIFANALGFGLTRVPAIKAWQKAQNPKVMTAPGTVFGEMIAIGALLISVGLMSWIEKRSLADYYLPLNQAFGKRF